MADMNVNLQGKMDRLGSILRDGEVNKTELSEDIDGLFEAKQDGGDDPVDFNEYAAALASHADSISPDQVDDYLEVMREFAGMDGDANSFSQTEIDLMKQILAGEDISDTLVSLEEDRAEVGDEPVDETNPTENGGEEKAEEKTISDSEALSYAKQLHEATAGMWGTDEDAVESILYNKDLSSKDIVKIMDAYEEEYGKSLEKAIKNDFSGKAEDRLLDVLNDAEQEAARETEGATLTDKEVQNYTKQLYDATAGKWGTDEDTVNSILLDSGLSAADIQRIKAEYKDQYGKTLESAIKNDFSGAEEDKLLKALEDADKEYKAQLSGDGKAVGAPNTEDGTTSGTEKTSEDGTKKAAEKETISDSEALSYAKQLHEATAGMWGTDEDAVESILYSEDLSSQDIVKIMDAYEDEYGKSLEKAIKNDFSGKAEDRLLDVLNDAQKEAARESEDATLTDKEVQNYTKQLYDATAGKWGTDEDTVNSILLDSGLSAADIQRIKAEYKDQYGKSLESAIKNDFSGAAEDDLLKALEDEE